jgi:hypothetical protein
MTDQDNERVRGLAEYLESRLGGEFLTYGRRLAKRIAAGILAYPAGTVRELLKAGVPIQTLLDVAVEEGELERNWCVQDEATPVEHRNYRLPKPKPHVHEPGVAALFPDDDSVRLRCDGCDEYRDVPNRLPIEWPEDG